MCGNLVYVVAVMRRSNVSVSDVSWISMMYAGEDIRAKRQTMNINQVRNLF